MATFVTFEEIAIWQKARRLTQEVYGISKQGAFARDLPLRDQIRRASISVMSNIAEGFERGGTKEFVNFLSIARGSAGEVRSQLYVALDAGYLDRKKFDDLAMMTQEILKMLTGFMNYLQRSDYRGTKFRT